MHFFQGPKNSAKTESQSAAHCCGTPTLSTGHSARMPQEQRVATGNHILYPPLPLSQLSLQATLHIFLFPVHPIPLTRQTPHQGANTPTSRAKAAAPPQQQLMGT